MPSGTCFCGETGVTYQGEPLVQALCHCLDCKKISGSVYSTNIIVKEDGFEVKGTPKPIAKKADSGNTITSYFCSNCGTTLYRDGASFPGLKIIKAGVLDDPAQINEVAKPGAELFAGQRVPWAAKVEGTEDKQGMP